MCIIFASVFFILSNCNNEILIYLMPLIYILIGFASGAYEMFDHIAIYESSKDKYQTSYVTFERFIEGIVTSILPILSYTMFSENNNVIKITFILSAITYIILFIYFKIKNR